MNASFPALPVVKAAQPAPAQPIIVVDSREQTPLVFTRLPFTTGTLITGDYSFVGGETLFSVERKSIADLVSCCTGDNRARFERELHRLRGFRFKRLLLVGNRRSIEEHQYVSKVHPHAVMGTLAAFETRYDTPVVWADTPEFAATLVEDWVWWYARELIQLTNQLLKPILPTTIEKQVMPGE